MADEESEPKVLTNKEKRLLAVAQKKQEKADALARKAQPKVTAEKRKREDGQDADEEEPELEVEVLSHKEQRRRKKLAKSQPEGEDGAEEGEAGAVNLGAMHPSRIATSGLSQAPRTGFSVWVGNMSFFTPPEKLVDWFNSRGVDNVSRINMPKGPRKAEMNRGFAYLDLPSADMLAAALNLSEQPLDGRKLLIKDGSDFTGRPEINQSAMTIAQSLQNPNPAARTWGANEDDKEDNSESAAAVAAAKQGKTGLTKTAQKILRAQKNPPAMTLFLGNLSFNTNEAGVRELFEHSAKKRAEANPVKKAKSAKKIVKKAKASTKTEASDSDDDSDSDSGSESDSSSASSSSSSSASSASSSKSNTLKVGDADEYGEIISTAGIRKVRLGTFEDAPTKCKGFGFIDFHTVEFATASLLDTRNFFLDGRKIICQYASADATRRGASKSQKHLFPANPTGRQTAAEREARAAEGTTDHPTAKKELSGFGFAKKRKFVPREEAEETPKAAPVPGTFDPDAPLEKKHKETKEERQARRSGQVVDKRREKPGAALANAARASTAVVQSTGTKLTFDD